MKYVINNSGILATIDHIKTVTGVDIMPHLQDAIDFQFNDATGYIIYFTEDSVENLTGIGSIVIDRAHVKALEPINLNGWIPVDRVDELPADVDNYQACIVARNEDAITSSNLGLLNLGYIYDGDIYSLDTDTTITEGIFKIITL